MKTVAVLGGGPAGSFTAERLARAGLETIVFDEKLAWEKPCGGGVTFKAYEAYPFLLNNETPKKIVTNTVVTAPSAGAVTVNLEHPIVIFSRFDLNNMLLKRAEAAGARIEKTRVLGVKRTSNQWTLQTRSGSTTADFLVLATGARNSLRDYGTELTSVDTMHALGYYVPAHQDHIDIQFLKDLEGYIWVFPRCGHLSVGIGAKGESAQNLRRRLERYMSAKGISTKGAQFFGHVLPSLHRRSWGRNRVAGEGWLAVGDAAGLVDPITGEGIYYAMRSGDLASQVVLEDIPLEQKADAYRERLRHDFAADLEFGSSIARRVFLGRFLFRSVPNQMVAFMRRSRRFNSIIQDLFAGTQPYLGLKGRLLRNLGGTFNEAIARFLLGRMISREEPV
jgi:geranylgeranyl reductase family protein